LLAAVFLIASLAILGGALYVFRAGGTLAGGERRRAVRLAAAGIAVVFLVGMVASANLLAWIDLPEPASQDVLSVIELATGRVTAFPRCPRLPHLSLSPDGDRVYYPDCPNDGDLGSRLRMHDFGSGEDVVLAELDGRLDQLLPSPAGNRLLVRVRSRAPGTARPTYRHLVIDVGDGVAQPLEQPLSWQVYGWLDEDRLVVWRGSSRERSIALLDVDTGEIEVIAGGMP